MDKHDVLNLFVRKSRKQRGADGREHGAVYCDSKSERGYRDRREPGTATQHSNHVTDVLRDSLEELADSHLMDLLLHARGVTKLPLRCVARLVRGHAALDILARLDLDVLPDLFVELSFLPSRFEPIHDLAPSRAGFRMRPMATAMRSHFDVSDASCLRPAAVSL